MRRRTAPIVDPRSFCLRLSTPELATPAPTPRTSSGSLPRAIFRELRPKQWLKNGLVFLGLVYALRFTDLDLIFHATVAFAAFCAISSAGYIFNDIRDMELDKLHPTKRFRPIASGRLPVGLAW